MSGTNPYAVNGYSSTSATNISTTGRYGGMYGQQANNSSTSVNSYASRERRRRDETQLPLSHPEETPNPPYVHRRYGSGEYGSRSATGSRENLDTSDVRRDRRGMVPNQNSAINGYRPFSPRIAPVSSKAMDEVLSHIQANWRDMSGDDCVPVQVALKLMDPSSLGLADKETDFQQTHTDLQRALKTIVNEHHQDFNSSIGTYHKIQASIQASQSRVRYLKQALGTAQTGLLTTKPELKGLATSSQDLDDTLQLLSQIEDLRAVPENLEARISEKRFLTAVDLLLEALKLVRKSELDGIGSITELRTYFSGQESSLTEILVEELHDHLYLKSPYCQDRWKAKTIGGEDKDVQGSLAETGVNPWDRPVYHYLAGLDTKTQMTEDASRNPEADTFYYIHLIVEALCRLGQLEEAVTRVEQRMPVELYKVVDRTNNEVDRRHPTHLRRELSKDKQNRTQIQANSAQAAVLSDFLWTLYSKFEAIAEGHRVLHEVITGIATREQIPTPAKYTGSFKELWKLYQMEMRSLLHDYLATDSEASLRNTMTSSASGDVFARNQRDKNKKMFKLTDTDPKSSDLETEQQELDEILKTSVPGLVSKNRGKIGIADSVDRVGQDSSAAGHKLLAEPGVFNMTILLPPSLSFLQRLKDIVPVGSNIAMSTLTSFLDDFLINIFHPQLEEAVTELCARCMIDLEAFSQDSQWSQHSPRPIFKGTVVFMNLIRAFSGMLAAIPRDQIFTQLIISQLVSYYDKCYGYYKAMVSRLTQPSSASNASTRTLKAAAAFAQKGDLRDLAAELMKASLQNEQTGESNKKLATEVHLLLAATKASPLSSYDIISDPRSVHNLSLLYNSMQWLSSCLTQLRHVESTTTSTAQSHSRNPSQSRRWTLVTSLTSQRKETNISSYLPLTSEFAVPFDSAVTSFRNLAQSALITLHIDIRCGIIHQLNRSLRGPSPAGSDKSSALPPPHESTWQSTTGSETTPWVLQSPPTSASPLILELNHDLISFDTNISSYLGPRERRFITNGLSMLVDRVLIIGADWIGTMNEYGAQRMQIDALVVQQNLRNINAVSPTVDGSLTRDKDKDDDDDLLTSSHRYYDLFLSGPDKILQYVTEKKAQAAGKSITLDAAVGYNYDELRTLIDLCFSSRLKSSDWEESVKAKRALGDALLQLGELMWDSGPTVRSSSRTTGRSTDGKGIAPANVGGGGVLGMSEQEMFYE